MSFENTLKDNLLEGQIASPEKAEMIAYSVAGIKEMAVAARNKAAFLRKYELEDLAQKFEAKAAQYESQATKDEFWSEISFNRDNYSVVELEAYIELVEEQIVVLDKDLLKFEEIVRHLTGNEKDAADIKKASMMQVWRELSDIKVALINEKLKKQAESKA